MMFIPRLALLILLLASGQAEVTITGLNDVVVSAGGEAVLVCQVEQPYLFCSFINPEGKTFIQDPNVEHEGGRISFDASEDEKKSCGVKMSPVLEADRGAWRCKVTVMVDGKATVGESRALVTVLQKDSSGSDGDVDRSEEGSGERMEVSANGKTVSRLENDNGELVEEEDGSRNESRASDLENEETEIFPSTTISPEADPNYTKGNLGGAKDQNQATEQEFNQVESSSSAPQITYEVNPSAENSDEYLQEEVFKLPSHMEEVQEDESTDLTDEQVAVVTIVALMIVAIIFTAIAKIKKLLCFKVTTTEDAEDAEKSTLRMYSIEKNSKSSLDTLETNQKLLAAGGILSITQEGFRVQEKPQQIKDLDAIQKK